MESGWRQYTALGAPVVSFDFGYGIMQITSGMAGAFGNVTGTLDPGVQRRIADDYRYNIAYGARMLAQKWAAVPRIGEGDPATLEDWYYALWAYNGWGWVNNPNNPRFSRQGTPATYPNTYPYQERVLYLVAHPPLGPDGQPLWPAVPVTLPSRSTIGTQPGPYTPRSAHRQPPAARAALYRTGTALMALPGQLKWVAVHVTNTGMEPWPATGTNAVTLTYHLLKAGTAPTPGLSPFSPGVILFGQGATPLTAAVLPGKSVTFHVPVTAPATAGAYLLAWDLQVGTGTWFSATGVAPGVQPLQVASRAVPTPPRAPTATPVPARNENEQYVADTSYPDGSTVSPRDVMVKGWLVFNSGLSAWDPTWRVVETAGTRLGGRSFALPATPACATLNLVINLTAPKTAGSYRSTWRIEDPTGRAVGDPLTLVFTVRGPRVTGTPTPLPSATPSPTPGVRGSRPTPTATPVG